MDTAHFSIIADDFTGAADSGIHLRRTGARVMIVGSEWRPKREVAKEAGTGVVPVVNTESRLLSPEESYRAVRDSALRLREAGRTSIYKKIDSTIRGNIESEIAALLDSGSYRGAIVAPSAPKNCRTVIDGVCLVDDVPLAESPVGHDPFHPATDSLVSSRFSRRFRGRVASLSLDEVRGGRERLHVLAGQRLDEGARILIADAETEEDLEAIASIDFDQKMLLAGSSGLAEALIPVQGGGQEPRTGFQLEPGRVLFVVGSMTDTTERQLRRLMTIEPTEMLSVTSSRLNGAASSMAGDPLNSAAGAHSGVPIVVTPSFTQADGKLKRTLEDALPDRSGSLAVASATGRIAKRLILERKIQAVVVTGGETAARLVESMGESSFELIDEISPGIPFGYLTGTPVADQLVMVTKSGGFGREDAMVEIYRFLTGKPQPPENGR